MIQKIAVSALMIGAAAAPALAEDSASAPTAGIYACAEIATPTERLACFDSEVAALKAAESSGEVQTVNRAELKAIERDAFGFSMPSVPQLFRRNNDDSGPAEDELKEVTVAVKEIKADRFDVLTVYLEDGQVWRQIDTTKFTRSQIKSAENVTIKKASFGSFLMKLDDSKSTFRVRRIS